MKFNIWKYIYIVLFVAIIPVISWANPEKRTFTLVIDAGHGGHDAGAVGAYSKEKNINLKVALAFGKLVEDNCSDVKVIYTRKTDVFIPLQTRADIANRNKADLFISVHTNALPAGRQAYGSETYTLGMARANANLAVAKRENSVITLESNYQSTYKGFDPNKAESYVIFEFMQDKYMKQSVDLASCIQREYTSAGRPNKGVHQAGFLVLRNTSMPSVLTELGFITTPSEEAYLNSEQGVTELSRSIYNGFLNYRRMHERAANDIPANLPNHVEDAGVAQNQVAAPAPSAKGDGDKAVDDDEVAVVPVAAVPTERLVAQAAPTDEPNLRSVRSQTRQPSANKPVEATPRKETLVKVQPKAQPKAVEKPSKVEKKEDNKVKPSPTKAAPAKQAPAKATAKDVDNKKEPVAKKNVTKKEVEKKETPKASSSKTLVNAKDKADAKSTSKDKKTVDTKKNVSSKDNAKDAKTTTKKEQDKKKADDKKTASTKDKDKKTTSTKDKDNKTKKDTDKKTTTTKANVTYRIQVGAGKTQIDTKDPQFKGLSVNRVKEGTMNKYFYGTYHSYAEAQKALKTVKGKISSAYIVAYVSGKSVSVAEARNKENSK